MCSSIFFVSYCEIHPSPEPPVATPTPLTAELIADFKRRKPLRVGSLIVSIFGDCVLPRGGEIWLGSLIDALAPLGLSHRLVRTAAYRLVQDGILINRQVGRRSYYCLTDDGRRQFEEASQRIYGAPPVDWDGRWCLVLTGLLDSETRTAVRRDLGWLGFGLLAADVLAHPHPPPGSVTEHLESLGCSASACVLDATLPDAHDDVALLKLVKKAWDIDGLEHAYAEYAGLFGPLADTLASAASVTPVDGFLLRTFMIHEYRKVLLRDPGLPRALLPSRWAGHEAYRITRDLYHATAAPCARFVAEHMENQHGPLPAPSAEYARRLA